MMHSSQVVAMLLFFGACASEPTDVDNFTGKWAVTSGTASVVCGSSTMTVAESGMIEFEADTEEYVWLMAATPQCDIKYSVLGNLATVVPGQECTGTTGSGGTATITYDVSTFTLSGIVLTRAESGSATSTPAGGSPLPCTYNRNATYRRN